jgi:histidinol-phosphate aminotransferase
MTAHLEKQGGTFEGLKLLLCERPLPPLDEAIDAAKGEGLDNNFHISFLLKLK